MTGAELSALITAVGVSVAGILTAIAALVNARNSAAKVEELRGKLDNELKRREIDRRDIILIGDSLADARSDTAAMALLINQLFNQYREATGKAPDVNIEMLKHMRTIGYITGKLGPLDVEAVRRTS